MAFARFVCLNRKLPLASEQKIPVEMKRATLDTKAKAMVVVGTRPEAIKMAPIILEFQRRQDRCAFAVVNTAQHRQLVDEVFSIYGITPDIDLDIMTDDQSLQKLFAKNSEALQRVFQTHKPHVLLIEGDTSTVFVASLMAFYNRIDVAHVEAGLRTRDIYNPFPEEVNRRITSVISKIHFAPTEWAKQNLLKEGHSEESIHVTGNPVIDSFLGVLKREHSFQNEILEATDYSASKVVLVTAHRRENHGEPLLNICEAILELTRLHKDIVFVYPVHPNPNIKNVVERTLSGKERIFLLNPLDYVSFAHLMKKCYLILTDSGGIQEEAPSVGKPVLVLRKTTERPEAVEAGTARVVGTKKEGIIEQVTSILQNQDEYNKMVVSKNPFGDGKAASRIVDVILARYSPTNK